MEGQCLEIVHDRLLSNPCLTIYDLFILLDASHLAVVSNRNKNYEKIFLLVCYLLRICACSSADLVKVVKRRWV